MKISTKEMIEAGQKMISALIDAEISKDMNGLGGSQKFEEWLKNDIENKDLILEYLEEKIELDEAIYIAMNRVKDE